MIAPAELYSKLSPETQQAVRQHRRGMVSGDVAAEISRAGGPSSAAWFVNVPLDQQEWLLPQEFMAYVDGLQGGQPQQD